MKVEPDALVFEWLNRCGQISSAPQQSVCRKDATPPGLAQSDMSLYIYFLSQGW